MVKFKSKLSLLFLLALVSSISFGAALTHPAKIPLEPLDIEVAGNRILDDDAVINMAGIDQDPSLSAIEVKRRLETSSLFSKVQVKRTRKTMKISVREKTNWFTIPYFSSDPYSKIFGVAGGESGVWGQNANILGRAQIGTDDVEATFFARDEYFLNEDWALGFSLDYEDSLHREFIGREISQRTANRYSGGSLQIGYHLTPFISLGLNTYIEHHRFEELTGEISSGLQVSHRFILDWGNFYLNEGLARGGALRTYLEVPNSLSAYQFGKFGIMGQKSIVLLGEFDWISRPKFEAGVGLPRYQMFEIGGGKLRSFATQEFRANSYFSIQNDFLLTAFDVWKLKVRPLAYADWAFVQNTGRTGLGGGFQIFVHDVAVPALQFFSGYGFNPDGFSTSAVVGPQF